MAPNPPDPWAGQEGDKAEACTQDRHSQVVFVNQDEESIQGQEADGPACDRHTAMEPRPNRHHHPGMVWKSRRLCARILEPAAHKLAHPPTCISPGQRKELPGHGTSGCALLTHVVGPGEEVDREAGLGQVRQDGVVHDHQHLLAEAEGQLGERGAGQGAARSVVHPAQARGPDSDRPPPPPPGPTLFLRKPSHITWKALLCSCGGGRASRLHTLPTRSSPILPNPALPASYHM